MSNFHLKYHTKIAAAINAVVIKGLGFVYKIIAVKLND
jgi:hypothetical protein